MSNFKPPFHFYEPLKLVCDSDGNRLCEVNNELEAEFICSILNAHFAPKEDAKALAYCSLCREVRSTTEIGSKCGLSCCGTIVSVPIHKPNRKETLCIHGVMPDHFCAKCQMQQPAPQPNREETDRVAVEYYKRERKLDIQCWPPYAVGSKGYWKDVEFPSFSYSLPWRIKPTKRRVVVEIHKTVSGDLITRIQDGKLGPSIFTLVGTAECEVEE